MVEKVQIHFDFEDYLSNLPLAGQLPLNLKITNNPSPESLGCYENEKIQLMFLGWVSAVYYYNRYKVKKNELH